MIVHSKDFVTNLDEACIQPNAVDLRIDTVERISAASSHSINIFEDGKKQFFPRQLVQRTNGVELTSEFYIDQGPHQVESQHSVTIPEGMVGWLIIRSTFARNGLLLGNGLYDSGYSGVIGGILHNYTGGIVNVERGTRFAQFVLAKAETAHLYAGHYNQNGGLSN